MRRALDVVVMAASREWCADQEPGVIFGAGRHGTVTRRNDVRR
jgi:hypothetical protein